MTTSNRTTKEPIQKCRSCGIEKPHTLRYFYREKRGRDELRVVCKKCETKQKRNYYQMNVDKYNASDLRKRARGKNKAIAWTENDWARCLEYWHFSCAVCGNQLRGLLNAFKPHADHWIPLKNPDCPGTIPENIVCLCHRCNYSKSAKYPSDWLFENYSRRKAKEIIRRVELYFAQYDTRQRQTTLPF